MSRFSACFSFLCYVILSRDTSWL